MLNEKGERELAYVVQIDEIKPIEGYDRVEYARINGWWVIVGLNQFKVGDLAIYIEVDSRVPSDKEQFAFLEKRDYKVMTVPSQACSRDSMIRRTVVLPPPEGPTKAAT